MRTTLLTSILAGALLVGLPLALGRATAQDGAPAVRLGVYDNRSIAIAYVGSRFNPVGEKMKAYEVAKAAGDTKRVEELEAWGEKRQRQLHRQGFGRVPVDDLLKVVEDRLPEVARRTGIDAIVWQCDYVGPDVEKIDVTMDLVMLFDPSDRSLAWAEQIRAEPFVDLDALEESHEH